MACASPAPKLFEERTKHALEPGDELLEERLQLVVIGRAHGGEADRAVGVAHEDALGQDAVAVEVDVEVEGVA